MSHAAAPLSRSSLLSLRAPHPRPAHTEALDAPLLPMVGAEVAVPLVSGASVRHAHLDCAASAPCLASVAEAVAEHLGSYASVHRGAGWLSQRTTAAFESARTDVLRFVGARTDDEAIFTRGTTEALNLLAAALPEGTEVIGFASEHHANLLPWRRRGTFRCLPVPRSAGEILDAVERALRTSRAPHRLVTVTGASNVTGELWPVGELARLAHRHGARLAVDAAQLLPHRRIDLAASGIDYLAFSGHKLYAPLGAGALVGRRDWLDAAPPWLCGGGAVARVTGEEARWVDGPARHEAGTPNVIGALALAAAVRTLEATPAEVLVAHERRLGERLLRGLRAVPGVEVLWQLGVDAERVPVASFRVAGLAPALVAAALSAEHGISVRDGAFCAHPLLEALVGGVHSPCGLGGAGSSGAVRASLGAGSCADDVERLIHAVRELAERGPRWRYRVDAGRPVPDPDPRCPAAAEAAARP